MPTVRRAAPRFTSPAAVAKKVERPALVWEQYWWDGFALIRLPLPQPGYSYSIEVKTNWSQPWKVIAITNQPPFFQPEGYSGSGWRVGLIR